MCVHWQAGPQAATAVASMHAEPLKDKSKTRVRGLRRPFNRVRSVVLVDHSDSP